MSWQNEDEQYGIRCVITRLIPSGKQLRTSIIKTSITKKWGHNDFKVKYCPKCKQVWDWHRMSNWVNVMYHQDFPRYGLSDGVCFICDPNEYQGSKAQIRVRHI